MNVLDENVSVDQRHQLLRWGVRVRQIGHDVRRVPRHPQVNTQAKRMGALVWASFDGIRLWRRNEPEQAYPWP
jgi:hypothetical protein